MLKMADFVEGLPPIAIIGFIVISAVLQQVFPPYPGDSVNIFAGYLCGISDLPPVVAYMAFLAGTVSSSLLLYDFGTRFGPRVLNNKLVKAVSVEKRLAIVKRFQKFGVFYLMLCKFLPGLNSVALLLAGVCNMDKRFAYPGITAAAVLHNTLFFYAGRTVGENLEGVDRFLHSVNKYAIGIAVISVVGIGIYIMIRRYIKRRHAQHEAKTAAANSHTDL